MEVDGEMARLQRQIEMVENDIKKAENALQAADLTEEDTKYWQKEKQALRLKKQALLERNDDDPRAKRPKLGEFTSKGFRALVNSAANSRGNATAGGKFWKMEDDPLISFNGPFLIWIREEYRTLEDAINKKISEGLKNFQVLGTEGIGKSLFGFHWIMRLGQQGHEKVLYKLGSEVYILDLHQKTGVQRAVTDTEVRRLMDKTTVWLVIDGKQKKPLGCRCYVLQVCSTKKSSFEEFGKSGLACKLYLSTWSRKEVEMFLDDFEPFRNDYGNMKVNVKETMLKAYDYLGGVPRYVLQETKTEDGMEMAKNAVRKLGTNVEMARQLLSGGHIKISILHLIATDDHTDYRYTFASDELMEDLAQQYVEAGNARMVDFLKTTYKCAWVGSLWGKLYEPLVHRLLSQGGVFKIKEVFENGVVGSDEEITIKPLKVIRVSSAQEFASKMVVGTYVISDSEIFPTLDSSFGENTLIQITKSSDHGYKALGLELVDAVLKRTEYKLWLVVPSETYPHAKWQQWTNSGKSNPVFQKMKRYVVEVDYTRLCFER